MQALTLLSTRMPMPGFHALPEKAKTLCKATALALPLLAIAGATYLAPIPLLLAGVGICYLSVQAVQKALSGTLPNQEQAIQMIVGAILISGITLGGLTLGLTPACFSVMITAFQASSFGSLISQLALGAFYLTTLVGYGGGLAHEAFNNADTFSLEKLQTYFKDLKNNICQRRSEDNNALSALSEYFFLIFRKTAGPYLILGYTDTLPDSIFYLISKEEISYIINHFVNAIKEDAEVYPTLNNPAVPQFDDEHNIETIVSNTTLRLQKLTQILSRLPESEQEMIIETVEGLRVLENIPELQEIYLQFRETYSWIFDIKLQTHLSNEPAQFIAEINTYIVATGKALDEKKDANLSSKELYDMQTRTCQTKHTNTSLEKLYPLREDLKTWGAELTKLIERLLSLAAKFGDSRNQQLVGTIDTTEPIWNLLISNANTVEKVNPLITELKQLLKVADPNNFESKMVELGLGSVKDLFDKGIITKEEYNNKDLVQRKVLDYIRKVTSFDIQDVAQQGIFRVAVAFALLAPLAVSPLLAISGALIGIVGFGLKAIQQDKAVSFQDMWKWLKEKRERFVLAKIMGGLARRTLSGLDQITRNDTRRFIATDIFGKMRLLSEELAYATLLISLAKIKVIAFIIMPILGAMLGREAVEPLFALAHKFMKQKVPLQAL